MNWKIPLFAPDFGAAELEAVQKPLQNGWITMGEITAELEREFAQRCGVKHAIAVNNCTAALHLAVAAAGVGPGDEVICPTLTFVATANAARYVGAKVVFCDSAGETNLNAGPEQIAARITSRTKAVMVLHYAGFPANMPAILDLAARHKLVVIEDCAHALFSTLHGRVCGSWGLCGAFSFFGNKNMTCGEGGMVTSNDDDFAARVRNMRSHGMTTLTLDRFAGRAFSYDVIAHGYNYRMDEIRSNLALAQMRRLDHFLIERTRVRNRYCERLSGSAIVVPDFEWGALSKPGDRVGYHVMPVLLPKGCDRLAVMNCLKEQGVQSSIHYPPVHTFSAFKSQVSPENRPERTEALAARELTVPMYPTLTNEQVDYVCQTLLRALGS